MFSSRVSVLKETEPMQHLKRHKVDLGAHVTGEREHIYILYKTYRTPYLHLGRDARYHPNMIAVFLQEDTSSSIEFFSSVAHQS